jgi:uncharacterized protein YydD (DUF2326 family)
MILTKLYSETNLILNTFYFGKGLNIILGNYSKPRDNTSLNGIGKSSLIRLIDFLLLSNSAEKKFLQPRYNFLRDENHNIILEFESQGNRNIIKRTFKKEDAILFSVNDNYLEEYTKPELKKILTNKIFPFNKDDVFFVGERYGTLMDFFIKDDLENQKRDGEDPLNFSAGTKNQISKAIFNFFLLGLPTKDLIRYEEKLDDFNSFNTTAKVLEEKIKEEQGKSIEEFKSERFNIEQKIEVLEISLNDYQFLENYKNIEKDLIEVTENINSKLKEYHSLCNKQKRIKESYQFNETINLQEIKKIYNEVLSTFGNLVSKTLEEITIFKNDIIENRSKHLVNKELELQKYIDITLKEISILEGVRSKLYKRLEEKGALESIKNTYEMLTNEKTILYGNLQILGELNGIQDKLVDLNVKISEIKRDITNVLKIYDHIINEYRKLFHEILQNAIIIDNDNPTGYFDISIKSDSNRNQLPFKIEVEIPKADALGQSRLKIVAYDIMVFLMNIIEQRNFPYFLIHDGAYHGISLITKIKALNFMFHKSLIYPQMQYIITLNEDEIYIPSEKRDLVGELDFNIEDFVIARFSDNPNEMIFKRDFQ